MDEREVRRDSRNYRFGGFPVTQTNLLILISDLEGTYQNLKYMGFKEDMDTLDEMKKRYYKLYFKTKKEDRLKDENSNT
tara:strand:+ start:197 stop:433 length:237 start_codon:yes stop_codon:yes gene_type:complete